MKSERPSLKKKPYRPPRLTVYGDLRRLTMAKRGSAPDGAGKPRTRVSGPPA
jgi:hypothetical protein